MRRAIWLAAALTAAGSAVVLPGAAAAAALGVRPATAVPTATVGSAPHGIAVDGSTGTVYVANDGSDSVSVLDEAHCDGTVQTDCAAVATATLAAGAAPFAVAADDAVSTVYVADSGAGEISILDGATCDAASQSNCAPVASPPVGDYPTALVVDSSTGTLYVANEASGTISVIATAACNAGTQTASAPVATIDAADGPLAMAEDPGTSTLYVTEIDNDSLALVDTANCNATVTSGCTTEADEPVGAYPSSVALDPATGTVYVTDEEAPGTGESGALAVIDEAACDSASQSACAPVATPPVEGAFAVAIDQPTDQVYVADANDDVVDVLAGAGCDAASQSACTPQELATVGNTPDAIGMVQSSSTAPDTAYVANLYSGTVSLLGQPAAPSSVNAVYDGGSEATVSWTAPADGGVPVASYTIVPSTSCSGCTGLTVATPETSTTVGGLPLGPTYQFSVVATSLAGPGPASALSNEVTPGDAPGPPGAPAVRAGPVSTPGDGQLSLAWTAAAANGPAVTSYRVIPTPACATCTGLNTSGAISTTVGGLVVGTSYTFAVVASNALGAGRASSPSQPVTPTTVASAPVQVVVAVNLAGVATVTFGPPAQLGGLRLTGYSIETSPACSTCGGTNVARSPAVVTGLHSGTVYRFFVVARNADGASAAGFTAPIRVEVAKGYWLAGRDGAVFGLGASVELGASRVPASDPMVGMAASADGKGYFLATADGVVYAYGDAHWHGDLPSSRVKASNIVAIAVTADGDGYWLVSSTGAVYAFGNATYHGSLPALHVNVTDVVGMVGSAADTGYLLVGADGGVFVFGRTGYYGSLPGLHVRVHDIRSILPSATGRGYVLVGADGGAFVFGHGTPYFGSLPGRHIHVSDIVGLAITPDGGGYEMAGSNGAVYGFGDATVFPSPKGLAAALPVAAIAGV